MIRLAILLGKSIREIEALDSREISEWIAYDQVEPLPDPWWMMGQICTTMAKCWSKGEFAPKDFIPVKTLPQVAAKEIKRIQGARVFEQFKAAVSAIPDLASRPFKRK